MKEIEEAIAKLEEKRSQVSFLRHEAFQTYTKMEKAYKKYDAELTEIEDSITMYKNRLMNEKLNNIVGKYFIYEQYRDDTKLGHVQIGQITGFRTEHSLDYDGITLYYSGNDYHNSDDINVKEFKSNNDKGDWVSVSGIENNRYKIISEEEFDKQHTRIVDIITMALLSRKLG